ncbi:dihydropteroate synthase [Eshraghiella crossota]|uniref:dihydropteroate synthase n=1 Tax=Eshraghiella crossota TaxID=45851 RepID=UPI003AB82878
MIIGGRDFNDGHTHVMGILNVTPDSFSDGGKYNNIDAALLHTKEMIEDGAHIIDIGGESTRPGYTMISDEEEIERVCPVIEKIKNEFDIPVSIDTYKSRVASAAITSGADLINDIWGLKYDDDMAAVIAGSGLPCCIMHNRNNTDYSDFIKDLNKEMLESVNIALNAGIDRDKIIIDPGVGFGKEYIHNILCLRHLDEFCKLGYPVLLGTSRKSVIGLTLDLPKDEREEGTLVTTVIAVMNRCMFVRVHDVKQNYRTIKMTEGIYGRNSN